MTTLSNHATPALRLESARLRMNYRAHVVQCIRAAKRAPTFDQWFARVIVATLANA